MTDTTQTGRFSKKELINASENGIYDEDITLIIDNAYKDPATVEVLNLLMNATYTDEKGKEKYLIERPADIVNFLYDCSNKGRFGEEERAKIKSILSIEGFRKLISQVGIGWLELIIGKSGILNSEELESAVRVSSETPID